MSRLAALVRVGAIAALASAPEAHPQPGAPIDADLLELHNLVNAHRQAVGCPRLLWHEEAARVAGRHSEDMAARRYLDHVSPEGESFVRRLLKGGVTWHGPVSENLALTPAGPPSVMELWLDSPGHKRNLETCSFTHHGVGRRDGYWTQLLIANPEP